MTPQDERWGDLEAGSNSSGSSSDTSTEHAFRSCFWKGMIPVCQRLRNGSDGLLIPALQSETGLAHEFHQSETGLAHELRHSNASSWLTPLL